MQQLNTLCFTLPEQSHDPKIDEGYFFEIQSDAVVGALYFLEEVC